MWLEEADGQPVHYNFDYFADEVLPFTRYQLRELRTDRAMANECQEAARDGNGSRLAAAMRFTAKTLRAGRMADLRKLMAKRGGIVAGMRERMLFVLMNEGMGSGIIHPAQADIQSVIERGKTQYRLGHESGKLGLFRFKGETLIDWFEVESGEMRDNEIIIDTAEKYRRKQVRDVAGKRAERRAKAHHLHSLGWSSRQIAAHLECGRDTVQKDLETKP